MPARAGRESNERHRQTVRSLVLFLLGNERVNLVRGNVPRSAPAGNEFAFELLVMANGNGFVIRRIHQQCQSQLGWSAATITPGKASWAVVADFKMQRQGMHGDVGVDQRRPLDWLLQPNYRASIRMAVALIGFAGRRGRLQRGEGRRGKRSLSSSYLL